jgi:hypothetical protein
MSQPDGPVTEEELERRGVALAKQLRGQMSELREHRAYDRGFKKRLATTWSQAFTLYEVILLSAFDAGSTFDQVHRPEASQDNDFRFEALTSLHAQACLVAGEVYELLRGGWPHGAHARSRTLHELAVFAGVIAEHPEVAERFLVHDAIEDARSLDTYQAKLAGRSGYKPFTKKQVDSVHARRDAALKRFDKPFGGYYGWAVPLFPPKQHITFEKLEELAGLSHLRPFYDWATHIGVHASSRGARLNVLQRGDERFRLAGPTNAGLADPAGSSITSLVQVTTSLLVHGRPLSDDPTPVVVLKALLHLADEAGDAFLAAHRQLEEKEAKIQQETKREAGGRLNRLLGRLATWSHSRNSR